MEKFEKLGLSSEILKVIKEEQFKVPSEIQEQTIPLALAGKDIIGGSATGSGKTLAFASSIIDNLKPNGNVQALILTPTRELAEQVSESIKQFSKYKDINVFAVYGGVSIEPQIKKITFADVVVGTPGRILDHLGRRTLNLKDIKFLVLDEVDRMFDMGFHQDVERILHECPQERQTMLFSATISPSIDYLAKKYTNNPVEVSVEQFVDHSQLKQIYYDVENNQKFSLLVHLLDHEKAELIMVFCSTRRNVDFVTRSLYKNRIDAHAIHGGLSQNQRTKVLQSFHTKRVHVLVCTDVAARGLDIKGVSHVYNYDLPPTPEDYIHRIGRTARAGKNGKAVNLLSNRDYENFEKIINHEKLKIDLVELPEFKRVPVQTDFGRDDRRGYAGGGRSNNSSRDSRPRRSYSSNSQSSSKDTRPKRSYGSSSSRSEGRSDSREGNSHSRRSYSSNSQSSSKDTRSRRSYGSSSSRSGSRPSYGSRGSSGRSSSGPRSSSRSGRPPRR